MKKVPMPAEDTVGLRAYLEQLRDDYLVRRAAENKTKRPVRTTLPTSVYAGMEDLLLKHGRFYVPQPLPKPYQRGSLRRCFDNAYQSALRSAGRLRYVEGLAVSGETPVHHAWCVDDAGRVVRIDVDDERHRSHTEARDGRPRALHAVRRHEGARAAAAGGGSTWTTRPRRPAPPRSGWPVRIG